MPKAHRMLVATDRVTRAVQKPRLPGVLLTVHPGQEPREEHSQHSKHAKHRDTRVPRRGTNRAFTHPALGWEQRGAHSQPCGALHPALRIRSPGQPTATSPRGRRTDRLGAALPRVPRAPGTSLSSSRSGYLASGSCSVTGPPGLRAVPRSSSSSRADAATTATAMAMGAPCEEKGGR